MSELQEPSSTTIEAEAVPAASGAGTPSLSDAIEPPLTEPQDLRSDIAAAFNEEDEAKAAPEIKGAKEEAPKKNEAVAAKPAEAKAAEAAPEAKAAPAKEGEQAENPAEAENAAEKAEDRSGHREPPKSFLPDSREVWKNVPRVVRRDIETMTREHETEVTQLREAGQRYESIKPYDDLAKSNGIDLTESLRRVSELENLIQANPLAGLNRILQEAGPRKADGQPFSLYEVADFIVKQGPQGYRQLVTHRQQQQGPSEVDQLKEQVAAMQAEMKAAPIILKFAEKNDRYYELEEPIALFLQSGMIPPSLSPEDRLAAAYDMAVRIKPASNAQARPSTEDEGLDRRAGEASAAPSIKSSPGAVTEEVDDQAAGGESIVESIHKAKRRLNA